MDMILLDWTRMGKVFCLAGAVIERGWLRPVRPLLVKFRAAPVRNVGWSGWFVDGYGRWDIFELVGPTEAPPEPPHLEDLWVRSLRPRRQSAPPEQRRQVLQATATPSGEAIFGAPLTTTRAAVFLRPGEGQRSLATVVVPAGAIRFSAAHRDGAPEPDFRVSLGVPPFEDRLLPVKDHHLLLKAERAAPNLAGQVRALNQIVQRMGPDVAVRLGLSRPFANVSGPRQCWLMADGFFSFSDPQP